MRRSTFRRHVSKSNCRCASDAQSGLRLFGTMKPRCVILNKVRPKEGDWMNCAQTVLGLTVTEREKSFGGGPFRASTPKWRNQMTFAVLGRRREYRSVTPISGYHRGLDSVCPDTVVTGSRMFANRTSSSRQTMAARLVLPILVVSMGCGKTRPLDELIFLDGRAAAPAGAQSIFSNGYCSLV